MSKMQKMLRGNPFVSTTVSVLASVLAVSGIVYAATTIGNNVSIDGTLTQTGIATFADSVRASSTLLVTGATTHYGTLTMSGGTVSSSGLASIGTIDPAVTVDVSGNTGRVGGLQLNLVSSGATVTGFRGIDSRVTDSGTAASAVGVQGFATHLANVSTGELWGGNMIAKLTAGGVENLYGGVNEARVVAGAVGSGTHNYVTGGLNIYDVSGTATFGTETVKAASIGVLIGNNSNSLSKTKATGAFVAIIGGDTVLTTGGAAFKVLNHSVSFPSKFDYGLDLWSDETPGALNSYANADIRLQNEETIDNATNGTISLGAANLKFTGNFTGNNINIVPASIGTAGVKFFTAGTAAAILDVGAQTDRVYGFGTHLTTNFAGADTWVKGLDSRIVVTGGTQGNVQGVYSSVSKSGGVAAAQELWGASNAVTITGGSVANTYGSVGEVTLGASATAGVASGTDGSTPNYITAVLARSVVASAATLSDDSIEAPVIALVANDLAARRKATAAVVAILGGDTGSNTAGAAFKAMDFSSTGGYNFDYGLDFGAGVGGSTGPIGGQFGVTGNTFTQADIRLMNDETIDNLTNGGVKVSGWVRPYIESTAPDAVDPTGPVEGALAVDGGEQDCFATADGTDGGSLCVYTGAAWVVVKTW